MAVGPGLRTLVVICCVVGGALLQLWAAVDPVWLGSNYELLYQTDVKSQTSWEVHPQSAWVGPWSGCLLYPTMVKKDTGGGGAGYELKGYGHWCRGDLSGLVHDILITNSAGYKPAPHAEVEDGVAVASVEGAAPASLAAWGIRSLGEVDTALESGLLKAGDDDTIVDGHRNNPDLEGFPNAELMLARTFLVVGVLSSVSAAGLIVYGYMTGGRALFARGAGSASDSVFQALSADFSYPGPLAALLALIGAVCAMGSIICFTSSPWTIFFYSNLLARQPEGLTITPLGAVTRGINIMQSATVALTLGGSLTLLMPQDLPIASGSSTPRLSAPLASDPADGYYTAAPDVHPDDDLLPT